MTAEQRAAGQSFRIDIGPLRARWGLVGFAILWLAMMSSATVFALRETRFDCVRELGKQPRCVLTESPPLPHVTRYSAGAIGAIDVVQASSSKGGKHWDVMILDLRGAEKSLARYDEEPPADALATRLRAFLANRQALSFSFVPPRPRLPFLYIAFGEGIFLVCLWHAFHNAGHLLVDVDRLHGELRVRRRWFGILHGKQARYRLAELRDIELEFGSVSNTLAGRGERPEPGARLLAVRNSGRRFPLTPTFLPSPRQFETGLELLRAELGFAPREPAETPSAPPSAKARPREQTPTAAPAHTLHARVTAIYTSGRSRNWLLVAGVVLGLVTAAAVTAWRVTITEGRLEIRAEYRCRFGGMDILPGGVMSMSLAPGRYQVLVFDTAVAGNWQAQPFELRAGETKLVVCRPRAAKRPAR